MSDGHQPRIFAFVFARGGSKGIVGKNLRVIGGRSLLGHSIATARACPRVERVIVSTDSEVLAVEALRCGAEVPFMRPANLASDESPEWLAWQHAIRTVQEDPQFGPFDYFLSLPATAPLRATRDVEACLELLSTTDSDIVVTVSEARRHPAFNMLRIDDNGLASVYHPLGNTITRRQDAPAAWDMATVAYAARADWILRSDGMWKGRMRAVVVPAERAIDIDTELDLAIAGFLMERRTLNP